jgi:uncharacterized protein (TIGR02646 family)
MHKLDRDPEAPSGLNRYQHGRDQWGNSVPTPVERAAIWEKLNAMQGERCAYCEGPIDSENRHIEHFQQRSRYPQGTFDWHNLFGSCNRSGTCGDQKDRCGIYPPNLLIKPDVEDPEQLLVFSPDGSVRARAGLSPTDSNRAQETIRVFGLQGALRQIRLSHVSGYKQTAEEFAEMAAQFPTEDWLPLLEEEIRKTALLPYATAIKHVLTNQS